MEKWKGYGIKLVGVSIATLSLFGIFYHTSLWMLISIALIIASVTYIGDLFILPKINKALAVIGDFLLYFALYWGLGMLFVADGVSILFPSFAAAYLSTAAEAVFHIYMLDKVHKTDRTVPMFGNLQTEFAEEENVRKVIEEEEEE